MSGFLKLCLEITHDEDVDVMLKKKEDFREVRINTAQISSFRPSKDGKRTELFLSGGEEYVLGITARKLEDILEEIENFFEYDITAN